MTLEEFLDARAHTPGNDWDESDIRAAWQASERSALERAGNALDWEREFASEGHNAACTEICRVTVSQCRDLIRALIPEEEP